MITRWIVHDPSRGYLRRPDSTREWVANKNNAYLFRHKRDAVRAIANLARDTQEQFLVEPLQQEEHEVIFD